jgi:hypothetical protein
MLGIPLETYKASSFTMFGVGVFGLAAAVIGYIATVEVEEGETVATVVAILAMAPFALLGSWMNSIQLSLHQEGISYRSFFGSKEMRWDQIEKFTYSSVKQSINFIPTGTHHTFKLEDAMGQKLSVGNRVARSAELGQKLIEMTYGPLMEKIADRYNNGQELDFGAIRVSRDEGIRVKKTIRWHSIPWEQMADYAINEGNVYIWPVGKKYVTGAALAQVPNAFVLLGLLENLTGRDTQEAQPTDNPTG